MHTPIHRFPRHALLVFALAGCVGNGGVARGQTPQEVGQVEAAYLRKIVEFVQWPAVSTDPGKAFRVCVMGRFLMSHPLAQEFRAATVAGRKVEVVIVDSKQSVKACQVLFVNAVDTRQRSNILDSVKGSEVLTVGDDAGFLEAGGILQFSAEGNLLRFGINLVAARNAGLKFDSRVLSLAHRVVTEKGTTGS
ncbi:MAG TPA: YfiR family protein [Candidatus Eisenbacteria bacterium]|nr:YfiR family protein [Candidatus Eisenbacteria bacterium]